MYAIGASDSASPAGPCPGSLPHPPIGNQPSVPAKTSSSTAATMKLGMRDADQRDAQTRPVEHPAAMHRRQRADRDAARRPDRQREQPERDRDRQRALEDVVHATTREYCMLGPKSPCGRCCTGSSRGTAASSRRGTSASAPPRRSSLSFRSHCPNGLPGATQTKKKRDQVDDREDQRELDEPPGDDVEHGPALTISPCSRSYRDRRVLRRSPPVVRHLRQTFHMRPPALRGADDRPAQATCRFTAAFATTSTPLNIVMFRGLMLMPLTSSRKRYWFVRW